MMPSPPSPSTWRWFASTTALVFLGAIAPSASAQQTEAEFLKQFPGAVAVKVQTERAPYDPDQAGKTVAFWEDRTRSTGRGFFDFRELANAYLNRQREAGDIADAVRAEEAARQSIVLSPKKNVGAMLNLARALLAQHRFPEALEVAEAAEKLDPAAGRIVIDIRLELGDYDAARKALPEQVAEGRDMNLLALRSRFEEIEGKPEAALELMREAARYADERPDMPAEVVAWYHTMIGHHQIDAGKLEPGEKACEKALTIFPRDYRAMTGMAEAAAWRGDHAEALRWALDAIKISPQNPEALRLAGEASEAMGKKAQADEQYKALDALAHSFPRIYDRHWALFCLDHDRNVDEALAIAREDLKLRHDVGAHDTLAWACYKKGLLDEAGREMDLALAQGTQEAPMTHHAAIIARARGDEAKAAKLMARARELNPFIDAGQAPAKP